MCPGVWALRWSPSSSSTERRTASIEGPKARSLAMAMAMMKHGVIIGGIMRYDMWDYVGIGWDYDIN